MKKNKLNIILFVVLSLLVCSITEEASIYAKSVSLRCKAAKIALGKTKTIEIKGANKKQLKKAKWSVKSGKKCIKIKISKSKASIKVTGKKTGKAKVLCRVAGKKLVCKITVKTAKSKSIKPAVTATTPVNKATPAPVATLAPTP